MCANKHANWHSSESRYAHILEVAYAGARRRPTALQIAEPPQRGTPGLAADAREPPPSSISVAEPSRP